MKRIKATNGYTIYKATKKDENKYNVTADYFYIYFSSDIRDFGLSNSEWDWEVDTLETAEEFCNGSNYALAKEIVENNTTCATFEEITAIEEKLNSGMSTLEIEEEENNIIIEDVKEEMQNINVPGYIGKWSAFEKCTVNNNTYYILEHNYYGDLTNYLVVNNDLSIIFETYDDIVTCLCDYDIIL